MGSTTTGRRRAVRSGAAGVLLVLVLGACGLPGGGGPGTVRVIALTGEVVALPGPPSGGVYHGTFSLLVTNESDTDYEGSDVQLSQQGLSWAFIVSGGSCFTSGVAAGQTCQVDGAVDAPESAGPDGTDAFTAIVSLGAISGSVGLTAQIIDNTP